MDCDNFNVRWFEEVCVVDPELSVIIPIYNEAESIVPLYEELNEVLTNLEISYEILFIDDGSKDESFSLMKTIHDQNTCVRIIKFRSNFGQSAAMKAGFEYATGRVIVTMDGDMQNDPHDIPVLIESLKNDNYDVVCGWRKNRNDPLFKRVFSHLANRFRTLLTGESIHDSGCTLRAYKGDSVKDLELYGSLHRYIPAMLFWKGYHVGEIVINHRFRSSGTSKYNWKRLSKGFFDLLVISFWQRYSARPMHIFGGTGLFIGMVGFIIVSYLVMEKILYSTGLADRPLFLIGLFLIVIGIQFLAFGILADILLKVYFGQSGKKTYLIETILT